MLFPGVPWMVTVIFWCALNGHCYFLVCSGWSLLFPGVLWMVTSDFDPRSKAVGIPDTAGVR